MSEAESTPGAESTDTSPVVAALLSLIVPGLGMIIAGEPVKTRGVYWLGGTLIAGVALFAFSLITLGLGAILWFGWPIIHVAAGVDSYIQVDDVYEA